MKRYDMSAEMSLRVVGGRRGGGGGGAGRGLGRCGGGYWMDAARNAVMHGRRHVRRLGMQAANKGMDIVVMGYPGVGKGTYGKLLSKWLNIPHISSGDLIRDEIERKTPLGLKVEPAIRRGDLLPDRLVIDLIKARLTNGDASNGVLFDGFPRQASQVPMLDEVRWIRGALLLKLREDVLIEKAINRRICENCNRSYNYAHIMSDSMRMPAILPNKENTCDSCGGGLIHRSDDSLEIVQKRLESAKELSVQVENIYKEQNRLFEFELTSGVDDMWPILKKFVHEKLIDQ